MSSIDLQKFANSLKQDLFQLENKKIMVVGDIGVDEYIWGSVKRISQRLPYQSLM